MRHAVHFGRVCIDFETEHGVMGAEFGFAAHRRMQRVLREEYNLERVH